MQIQNRKTTSLSLVIVAAAALLTALPLVLPGCSTSAVTGTATPTLVPTPVQATQIFTSTPLPSFTGTSSGSATITATATATGTASATISPTPTCTPQCASYADAAHTNPATQFGPGANVYAQCVCLRPSACAQFVWRDSSNTIRFQSSGTTVPGSGVLNDFQSIPAGEPSGSWTITVQPCAGGSYAICSFMVVAPTPTVTPTATVTPT